MNEDDIRRLSREACVVPRRVGHFDLAFPACEKPPARYPPHRKPTSAGAAASGLRGSPAAGSGAL